MAHLVLIALLVLADLADQGHLGVLLVRLGLAIPQSRVRQVALLAREVLLVLCHHDRLVARWALAVLCHQLVPLVPAVLEDLMVQRHQMDQLVRVVHDHQFRLLLQLVQGSHHHRESRLGLSCRWDPKVPLDRARLVYQCHPEVRQHLRVLLDPASLVDLNRQSDLPVRSVPVHQVVLDFLVYHPLLQYHRKHANFFT